jgi:hypothetical protein
MEKPNVRIIDNQQEILNDSPNVNRSESDYLLAKYGYKQNYIQTQTIANKSTINNQSFEDMIKQQENEKMRKLEQKNRMVNQPQSISFNSKDIKYSEIKYSDLEVDNNKLGIKIQIVTDMKIS